MERKIIILGSGPEWEKCPLSTTDREVWAVAKMLMIPNPPTKVDRLFSLDDIDHLLTIRRGMFTKEQFIDKINDCDVLYFSCNAITEIPKSREYPFKEIINQFRTPYFTNTICYMIAYALWKGVTDIELWGVAQMGANEYLAERAGVEYWLGLAIGRGVRVSFKTPTLLLKNYQLEYPYGYVKTITQLMEDKHGEN